MSTTLRIDARYNGPPGSANGGYVCGRMAAVIGESVSIRLYQPPPLDTDLELLHDSVSDRWHLKRDEQLIAAAHRAQVHAHVPRFTQGAVSGIGVAPRYEQALAATMQYVGHRQHAFPTCFVCGPQRAPQDGLRIFAGRYAESNLVMAPWLPHAELAADDGKVRPEFIWAALDCPGYFASVPQGCVALLGELAVHIDRRVHVDEPCVIVGWPILIEGRKHKVGTALFDEEGEQCALGVATWIELG